MKIKKLPLVPFRNWINIFMLVFFIIPIISAQNHQSTIQKKLIGAELFYDQTDLGQLTVTLKKYVTCSHEAEIAGSEIVGVHQPGETSLKDRLELKLISNEVINSEEKLDCGNEESTCVRELVYALDSYLSYSNIGYDLTWGYYFLDNTILNIDKSKRQGVVLTVHVTNPFGGTLNHAPKLKNLPLLAICANEEYFSSLEMIDEDNDVSKLKLSSLSSHRPVKSNLYYQDIHVKSTMPKVSEVFKNESFITDQPPFIPIQMETGYSAFNPINNLAFQHNDEKQEMRFSSDVLGERLIGLTLSDFRDGILISEHQAFYLINIK